MTDPRLLLPLSETWEDLRVPGMPVWHRLSGVGVLVSPDRACWQDATGNPDPDAGLHEWLLDLSKPVAADLLARRLATALGRGSPFGVRWKSHDATDFGAHGALWGLHGAGTVLFSPRCITMMVHVPDLADLDPTGDARLDWGNLGSPRVVDIVALARVSRHVWRMKR